MLSLWSHLWCVKDVHAGRYRNWQHAVQLQAATSASLHGGLQPSRSDTSKVSEGQQVLAVQWPTQAHKSAQEAQDRSCAAPASRMHPTLTARRAQDCKPAAPMSRAACACFAAVQAPPRCLRCWCSPAQHRATKHAFNHAPPDIGAVRHSSCDFTGAGLVSSLTIDIQR